MKHEHFVTFHQKNGSSDMTFVSSMKLDIVFAMHWGQQRDWACPLLINPRRTTVEPSNSRAVGYMSWIKMVGAAAEFLPKGEIPAVRMLWAITRVILDSPADNSLKQEIMMKYIRVFRTLEDMEIYFIHEIT